MAYRLRARNTLKKPARLGSPDLANTGSIKKATVKRRQLRKFTANENNAMMEVVESFGRYWKMWPEKLREDISQRLDLPQKELQRWLTNYQRRVVAVADTASTPESSPQPETQQPASQAPEPVATESSGATRMVAQATAPGRTPEIDAELRRLAAAVAETTFVGDCSLPSFNVFLRSPHNADVSRRLTLTPEDMSLFNVSLCLPEEKVLDRNEVPIGIDGSSSSFELKETQSSVGSADDDVINDIICSPELQSSEPQCLTDLTPAIIDDMLVQGQDVSVLDRSAVCRNLFTPVAERKF